MWDKDSIKALRDRLGMNQSAFAKLMGVDARTVIRWESGTSRPTGAAEQVLNALREKLEKDPANSENIIAFVAGAVAIGGLAYLLLKLLESAEPPIKS